MATIKTKKHSFSVSPSLLLLLSISLFSLGKPYKMNNALDKNQQVITIDTFSEFPPEIDGCACYFSSDKKEFENKKYIYADDYGDVAFISINKKMTKFKISKTEKIKESRMIQTWISDKYKLTIDRTQIGQVEETWQQKGTLKLETKDGKIITKNIYGECGC